MSEVCNIRGCHRGHVGLHPLVVSSEPWHKGALCAQVDPELFFPEPGGSVATAKRVCRGCPVRADCLACALNTVPRPEGVWGATSQEDREKLHREKVGVQ